MRTLVTALRWELFKLTRQRASYVGFLLCLAFAVVMLIGFSSSHFRFLRGLERLGIDVRSLINGPFFASFSLQIGFFAVLPLLAATLGGNQIAGEAKDGTLRALLVRRRERLRPARLPEPEQRRRRPARPGSRACSSRVL